MCDGDVLEGDVELASSLQQVGSDAIGNIFTLGDEFGSIELRDNGFEDFVSDGWEDSLVVVETEVLGLLDDAELADCGLSYLVNLGQLLHLRSMQYS